MSLPRKVAFLAAAEAFQWLPPRVVRAVQLERLARMLAFCEERVPFYRERFRAAGARAEDTACLEDLRLFPTVTREEVTEAYPDRIRSREPVPGDVVFRTSGTSGLFMEIAYSERANDWLDAIYARALFATGYRPWQRKAYFWWEESPKPKKLYEHLGLMTKDYLPMSPDPRVQLEALREMRPKWIYNFPSVMMMIARIVEQEGIDEMRPQGIICHGEFMPKEIQREISRIFGCDVWDQYGAQEFNRMGWDCELHEAMHIDADSIVIEIMDGDRVLPPGEEGEIVVTGLLNDLMPLIRYRIGDAGRLVEGRCPCGRGLPLLEITEGRMDDILALPDGRHIGPRAIAPKVEELNGFTQYRLVQKAPDRVVLRVVWEPDAPPGARDALARTVSALLGPSVDVTLEAVDEIPLNRRGKLRKVVSEVTA